jgi:hypothetical protein
VAISTRDFRGARKDAGLCPPQIPTACDPGFGPPRLKDTDNATTGKDLKARFVPSQNGTSGKTNGPPPNEVRPNAKLVLFLARLFAAAFAGQGLLHTLFLTRFQIEGMALDLLDDVFLLNFALEPPQRIFQ